MINNIITAFTRLTFWEQALVCSGGLVVLGMVVVVVESVWRQMRP